MRSVSQHICDPADRIECRLQADHEPFPGRPAIVIGTAIVYATFGQAAAVRDALDRCLTGEAEPEPEPAPDADGEGT